MLTIHNSLTPQDEDTQIKLRILYLRYIDDISILGKHITEFIILKEKITIIQVPNLSVVRSAVIYVYLLYKDMAYRYEFSVRGKGDSNYNITINNGESHPIVKINDIKTKTREMISRNVNSPFLCGCVSIESILDDLDGSE